MNPQQSSSKLAGSQSIVSTNLESIEKSLPTVSSQRKCDNSKIYQSSPFGLELNAVYEDDDDERKEKKVKFIDELIQPNKDMEGNKKRRHSWNDDSLLCLDSIGKKASHAKKHRINDGHRRSGETISIEKQKPVEETGASPAGLTPLPDKNLLAAILDKLQKKDTMGAFANPVDVDELPDYYEVIEHPMNFWTVRQKLDDGADYKYLEDLEADVLLICSNAMLYNAPSTIYYRQARAIEQLAKKEFENLKHGKEKDTVEPQPRKVARRGRPPKSQKQATIKPPAQASAAPSVGGEDRATGSSPYNLRKGPRAPRHQSTDLLGSPSHERREENNSEASYKWNDEFPESIVRAEMKQGRRKVGDVTRRDTCRQPHPPADLANSVGDAKPLSLNMQEGLEDPMAYARSLARFAADLGPVAWKVASKKIASVLPPGTQFGPGWVGEIPPNSHPISVSSDQQQKSSSGCACSGSINSTESMIPLVDLTSDAAAIRPPSGGPAGPVRQLSSQKEAVRDVGYPRKTPFPPVHSYKNYQQANRFGGMFGHSDASSVGTTRKAMPGLHGLPPLPPQITHARYPNVLPSVHLSGTNHAAMAEQARVHEGWRSPLDTHPTAQAHQFLNPQGQGGTWNLRGMSWETMLQQQQSNLAVPTELNMSMNLGSFPSGSSAEMGDSSSQR